MKIINTGLFYFGTNGTAYHGKIFLSQIQFKYAIKHILTNRKVNKQYLGIGKYPYLSKDLLKEDIENGRDNMYALRVSATDYIVSLFKNTSRYHYKRQNYIIQVI